MHMPRICKRSFVGSPFFRHQLLGTRRHVTPEASHHPCLGQSNCRLPERRDPNSFGVHQTEGFASVQCPHRSLFAPSFAILALPCYYPLLLEQQMLSSSLLRSFTAQAGRRAMSTKVAVLGAGGGIGQPLSLLLKTSPVVEELACYDIVGTPGVAADLSHVSDTTQQY